ncbi:MAG: cell division protein FtsA [Candidatus Colwellbacteria bacterium RBG_13_48_8]|uniref:Cell division protein FtsA n=1 Tax=Candidatus Colwellbacteria bacterium RBG_13_48_8 TaxID=1797685 RepID=A0A1G1YYX7_9BACT|nr:MAG: cell division protein FtsA [Candidatus Colwellbacteria bacterium RBG_13_48_8]
MAQTHILGLDVGSHTVKAVLVEPAGSGKLHLLKSFTKPSRGLRRGVVVDMDNVVGVVNGVFDEVAEFSKSALKNVFLSVGGADVSVRGSRGSAAVSRANSEIHDDDIERAVEASVAIKPRSNRINLHIINQEFVVDGVGNIQDPRGMVGARLEVVNLIVDAFEPSVKNLQKCVKLAGGEVVGLVFAPLASAASVLSDNQKELGVVLIDMGAGTTGIAVYEENKLLHTKVFKIGANNITNDLALALRVPVEVADRVKLSYGYAVAKEVPSRDSIDLKKIEPDIKGSPSKKFVAEVIEARLSEICDCIDNELKLIGKDKGLPGGAVVVGGGAKLPGVAELIQSELKLATQIGVANPDLFSAKEMTVKEVISSPEYTCTLGLPLYSEHLKSKTRPSSGSAIGFIRRLTHKFLP